MKLIKQLAGVWFCSLAKSCSVRLEDYNVNIVLKLSLSQYSPPVLNSLKICKSSSVSQVSYATVFRFYMS